MKHSTKLLVLFAAVASAVGLAATSWAYFTATGTGTASATVGTWRNDTTTAVVSTGSPSVVGQQVTYTAMVTAPGSSTPTGNIAFFDAGSPIGSCGGAAGNPLSGASATCAQTYTAPGSHTINAAYQGDATYNASPTSPSITQVVNQASTTTSLTVTNSPVTYGSEQTAVFASTVSPQFAGSPQPTGTIAIKQGSTPLCSITLPAGSCSTTPTVLNASATAYPITATYSGDSNFTGSSSASRNLTVDKAIPTINWATPAAITYGTALSTTQLNATVNGGLPGTLVYDPTAGTIPTAGSASLSVIFTPTDTTNYAVATAGVTLIVNKATPTITWANPSAITYGTALSATQLNATASTPGSFVYSPVSGTVLGAGSQALSVTFTPTDTANYNGATGAATLVVNKASQTVSFTSTAPAGATVGGSTYAVTATGGASGNPVTLASGTTSVCTMSGSTVSFVGVGTCTINANQGGDTNYNAATQAQQSFSVGKGSQVITFTSTAPAAATVGGSTYTVSASASSGLTVGFTSATTPVCTLSGSTVSFVGAGTCTINANQAGNTTYNSAPQVQQSFTVSATLTITTVTRSGGNAKHTFSGIGGTPGSTITVSVCAANAFPSCTVVTNATATVAANGSWTTGQSSTNIDGGTTYFARAVQGTPSKTSAVFEFVAPS